MVLPSRDSARIARTFILTLQRYEKASKLPNKSRFIFIFKRARDDKRRNNTYFKTMMSLQRVVGFLLLWSCFMALEKTSALPFPPGWVYCWALSILHASIIQLLPGLRIKVPNRHSTYGRVKVKSIPLGFAASLAKNFFLGSTDPSTAYNLANETEPIRIRDLAQMLASLREDKPIHLIMAMGEQKGYCNYRRTALDITAIEQLGWKPSVSLKEGIKRILQC